MNHITFSDILKRRYGVIALTTAVMLIVVFMIQRFTPDTYSASTVLRIEPESMGTISYQQIVYFDRIINTYMEVATSSPMISQLKNELRLDSTYPLDVGVELIADSDLIRITVKDASPALARDAANSLGQLLVNEEPVRDYRISIIDPADTPTPPSPLRVILAYALALCIGLFGGFILGYWFEIQSPRLWSGEQIRQTAGLNILGYVPDLHKWIGREGISADDPLIVDTFRRLRTSILLACHTNGLKTLMVTSAEPRDGKSTIVYNLARSLAMADHRVVVVDADLHTPVLHEFNRVSNDKGLRDILRHGVEYPAVIKKTRLPSLKLITAGPRPSHPEDSLGSYRMALLLRQLKNDFDIILIDTPSILSTADASVLSPLVDGVVLVVCSNYSRIRALKISKEQLAIVNANLVGIVVNRAQDNLPADTNYYRRMRHSKPERPAQTVTTISQSDSNGKSGRSLFARWAASIEHTLDTIFVENPLLAIGGKKEQFIHEQNTQNSHTP
jgi:capsular exopolysaccharide synthesis family protein